MTYPRSRAAALLALILGAATLTGRPDLAHAIERVGAYRPPEARRVAKPKTRSLEYRLSWGLASIKADRAFARGIDGSGVTVAMIDAGPAADSAQLFGALSEASTDLVRKRVLAAGADSHARQTATLLAARLDGEGTVGAAYGAQLLAIRIDVDGSCPDRCFAHGADLARGIDYAVAQGARIVGVPMVGRNRLPTVEAALLRAAEAGAVIVAAAGNDGAEEVAWPARYAADPRLRDAMLIAGASTIAGDAAGWSNKAGSAADRYLLAPGEKLLVDCGKRSCMLVSGTSYAVPFAAGALSLLMARRPDLSAQQAARVLLKSASDRGERGVDSATGAGLLDVARAVRAIRKAQP